MAFARGRALRSLQSSLRHSGRRVVPRISAPARTQLVQRRYASDGGHGGQSSSDIPWAIGAVAVTIPSCWFLWPEESSHHEGGHAEHDEVETKSTEVEEKEESEAAGEEEQPKEDAEESKESDEKVEEKGEGDAQSSTPPNGEEEKKDDSKEGGEDGGEGEGKEESKDEGKDDEKEESKDEDESKAKPTGAELKRANPKSPKGEKGSMQEKQAGFSNTETRHPMKDEPGRSKKSDGSIETSKTMGTVDPSRPLK